MSVYLVAHWTDNAPSPVFATVIDARGPSGNVFEIIGTARKLLRLLKISEDRIERMTEEARAAGSYDAAIAVVERWFRVNRGA